MCTTCSFNAAYGTRPRTINYHSRSTQASASIYFVDRQLQLNYPYLNLATGVSRSRVREFGTVYPPHCGSLTLNLDSFKRLLKAFLISKTAAHYWNYDFYAPCISRFTYYYYYYRKKRFRWRNVKRLQGHLTNAKNSDKTRVRRKVRTEYLSDEVSSTAVTSTLYFLLTYSMKVTNLPQTKPNVAQLWGHKYTANMTQTWHNDKSVVYIILHRLVKQNEIIKTKQLRNPKALFKDLLSTRSFLLTNSCLHGQAQGHTWW